MKKNIDTILKEKRKKQKNKIKNHKKEIRRKFVNPTCIKCDAQYHILVNSKEDWTPKILKSWMCVLCRPMEIKRVR